MRDVEAQSRRLYDARLYTAYYSSPAFWRDTAAAAGKVGMRMGLRQALGFVLAEVWFAVKERLAVSGRTLKQKLAAIVEGVRAGFVRARTRFGMLLSRFSEGCIAGIFSSLTTTLCNTFVTTCKSGIRLLRQSYATIVAAGRVLIFNPDHLLLGDRMKAALTILGAGASAAIGLAMTEALRTTGLGAIPEVGDILATFVGVFAAGALSCALACLLDTDKVRKAVAMLNEVRTIDYDLAFYRKQAEEFEQHMERLMECDLPGFQKEAGGMADLGTAS